MRNYESKIPKLLKSENGFTLVELSVVILIIGLLVAGVVAGQTLVRQASIRSLITEYNQYKVAVNSFKLEYDELPGDFSKAADFWAGASSGNADRKIFHLRTEGIYFWDHLERAELISGSFSGAELAPNTLKVGVDVPLAKFGKGVTFQAEHVSVGNPNTCAFAFNNRLFGVIDNVNLFTVGNTHDPNCSSSRAFLEVQEAYGLDVKIDDGEPANGILYSANTRNYVNPTLCVDVATDDASNTDPLDVDYYLGNSGKVCRLLLKM